MWISSYPHIHTENLALRKQEFTSLCARLYYRPLHQKVTQSCLTLCDPMECSLPGSSIHGILQARVLEWVAISFSRGSSRPRDQTRVSCIAGRCFTIWATRETPITYLENPKKSTKKNPLELVNSVKLHDTKSICKNQLHFYTLRLNNLKKKLQKQLC